MDHLDNHFLCKKSGHCCSSRDCTYITSLLSFHLKQKDTWQSSFSFKTCCIRSQFFLILEKIDSSSALLIWIWIVTLLLTFFQLTPIYISYANFTDIIRLHIYTMFSGIPFIIFSYCVLRSEKLSRVTVFSRSFCFKWTISCLWYALNKCLRLSTRKLTLNGLLLIDEI